MLRQSEKQKILDETMKYNVYLAVNTGAVVEPYDKGLYVNIEDENDLYEHEDVIRVVYDKKIRRRIMKYVKVLLSRRGVKDIDKIDERDKEVREILKRFRIDNKRSGINDGLTFTDTQAAIEMVRDKYEPAYTRTVFQVIYWAIMRDSMFETVKEGIACRFDIVIPDEYWEVDEDSEHYDDIDELIFADMPEPLRMRQNDKLEIMVALATELVNSNEDFGQKIGELSAVVFASFSFLTEDFDEAGMFRSELVRILPEYVESEHRAINRSIASSGVFINAKKTGKPESQESKEEIVQPSPS